MIGAQAYYRNCGSSDFFQRAVGEHSVGTEGVGVSHAGAYRREHPGMSSENFDENSKRRKPKVSPSMSVRRRLGGP